jgi:hypothetical protein
MSQPASHGVARRSFASTSTTPLVWFNDPASEDGPVDFCPLSDDREPKLVEPRERCQIRAGEARI